jgi:hypothetical protein
VIRETESDHFLTAEASDSNVRFTSYDDLRVCRLLADFVEEVGELAVSEGIGIRRA